MTSVSWLLGFGYREARACRQFTEDEQQIPARTACDYSSQMPRAKSDVANTALRIFLQEMGAAYDEERGLPPYKRARDLPLIAEFFDGRCCYCGIPFDPAEPVVQDHLVPMNKTDLGLHAMGNVVPACAACNARKQGRDWREFIVERAGADAHERLTRVKTFVTGYHYAPSLDLRDVAAELYEEMGSIAMTLISSKVKRVREKL